MKINSDFRDLLSLLNDKQVEYLLVGGLAVIVHSEPRYTKDIDIWVRPSRENAERVYGALAEFGAPLSQLGITIEDFEREGYFVQFGREPVRVDVLMSAKGLDFEKAWSRKEVVEIDGVQVNVIARSDLINNKLEVGRPQDLIDAKALKQSGNLKQSRRA